MAAKGYKIVFIAINILLLFIGIVLLALGAWVLIDDDGLVNLAKLDFDGYYGDLSKPGLLDAAAVIAMIEGAAMILVTLLAFFGVGQQSKCFLALYAGFVLIMVLVQAVIIALTVVVRDRLDENLKPALNMSIQHEYQGFIDSTNRFSLSLDRAHVKFECCGLNSYNDYHEFAEDWKDRFSLKIPKTCCKLVDKDLYLDNRQFTFVNRTCAREPNPSISNLNKTCYNDIHNWLDERIVVILAMTVVFAGIQFFGVIFSLCIIRALRGKEYY
ncbi:tetraspanin-21-like [Physella acuta]|uniref:tetraspanin-21-like n=1 Tax=Physella acuta TaxID=109671 RepID=UPI0027DC9601|nr:tetraspanin-21-like [Physella acuta]